MSFFNRLRYAAFSRQALEVSALKGRFFSRTAPIFWRALLWAKPTGLLEEELEIFHISPRDLGYNFSSKFKGSSLSSEFKGLFFLKI